MSTRLIGGDPESVRTRRDARREQTRNEVEARVETRIYKDFESLPQILLSDPKETDPLMVNLLGEEAAAQVPIWDRVVDFGKYTKSGFDSDVMQSMFFKKFTGKLPDGTLRYETLYHFLHPDGTVYAQETGAVRGRGISKPSDISIGKWDLTTPKETAEYTYVSRRFLALYGDDEIEVDFNSTWLDPQTNSRYCFAHTIDVGSVDPMEKVPIRYEQDTRLATGPVVEIEGKHYTYRDFIGILRVTNHNGSIKEHLLCNSKRSTIDRHRIQYANALAGWRRLTSNARREIFNARGRHRYHFLQPRLIWESFTASVDAIVGREKVESFFVLLRKKEDGTFEQVVKP